MKIRNGFVSNSSSSSFIVIFPREPKNADDVKDMLFSKDTNTYWCPYDYEGYSVDKVSETVWNDICKQEKNDLKAASEIIQNFDGNDSPEYDDFEHIKDDNQRWKAYESALILYGNKKLKEFFNIRKQKMKKLNNEKFESGVLYCFEYSDNEGSYFSALEHGDLFKKLKHIKVSNH